MMGQQGQVIVEKGRDLSEARSGSCFCPRVARALDGHILVAAPILMAMTDYRESGQGARREQ